jgi:magnesium chelatase subunit I
MALAVKRYPFTAIAGLRRAKTALILNVINPDIGGVLLRGEKGTGKSLLVRSIEEVLPEIDVFEGCRFNCDPAAEQRCADCRTREKEGKPQKVVSRKMRTINLPLNVSEDRLLGAIDLEKVLTEGIAAFEPGLLAQAHRNVLYIDEVNLLDDAIIDVLMDVAAMGVITVEREGISISYPSKFVLVGSMNPEEGEIRPQFLDRLALLGESDTVKKPEERSDMLRALMDYEQDFAAFQRRFEPEQAKLRDQLRRSRELIPSVKIPQRMFALIAKIGIEFNVDGHRADIIMERASKAHAALNGRKEVNEEDVTIAGELTLPHRMRKQPFEEATFSVDVLRRLVAKYMKEI